MIMEKQNRKLSSAVCSRLKGKTICLCGSDERMKELMKHSLDEINGQNELMMQILTEKEVVPEKGKLILVTGIIQGTGSESLNQLDAQMAEMETIMKSEPEAVVYISDSRVYGKSFGPQISRNENELGYVCHTSMEEMELQCMRMAEHLVCRMAKEEQMPVKTVRLDRKAEEKELYELVPYILGVLLNGMSGEIYNVAAADLDDQKNAEEAESGPLKWKENRSPLTAMEIRLNTEKVRNYVASELFE